MCIAHVYCVVCTVYYNVMVLEKNVKVKLLKL